MPLSDILSFIRNADTPQEEVIAVPWGEAMAVLGDLPEEPGIEPVRFRVSGFPSEDQLEMMRARAIRR